MNKSSIVGTALLLLGGICSAGEVEVLHWWTSSGEAQAVDFLKEILARRGHSWKDFSVVGGGGGNAMAALKTRVLAGAPPAAATIKGPAIQEWAALGTLANLDAMASFDGWDEQIPKSISESLKYRGHYVAVPVNIHRNNWLWANAQVLKKSGVQSMPSTWEEFFDATEKVRKAGFIPLAHGGQDWQDFSLFDTVALSTGGAPFYMDAFVNLDRNAMSGDSMRKSLALFRKIKSYTDPQSKGRDWNAATAMVINGKAAFQFMGDWAKAEFLVAKQIPGVDFYCSAAPGTQDKFSFLIDSFAMFQLRSWEAQKAQGYLAYALMSPEFQEKFNTLKGSIPVRQNVSLAKFDDCAKASSRDFKRAEANNTLVPSVAFAQGTPPNVQGAIQAAVTAYWGSDAVTVDETIVKLQNAAGLKHK